MCAYISGLASLTNVDGNSEFTVNAGGVLDLTGHAGIGSQTTMWTVRRVPPKVLAFSPIIPSPTNNPVPTIDVTFSEPIDPATFDVNDLTLTRNLAVVDLTGVGTITYLAGSTWRIDGLTSVTNADGNYVLTVNTAKLADSHGVAGVSSKSIAWIKVSTSPTIISIIAAGLTSTPSLTWSPVVGAALYDVWIDNLTTGASAVVRNSSVQGTTLELNGIPSASYRAFVRGRDLPGGGFYAWSSGFNFEVGRAPRITSPIGNGQSVRPTITWTSVSGAVRYEIWLGNLATGRREISDANLLSPSYTPTTDLTNSNYYRVWIRAFDSSGAVTPWSLPVTFTIASDTAKSQVKQRPLSLIGNPLLERLFAYADSWLHEQMDEMPEPDVPVRNAPAPPSNPSPL